VSVAFSWRRLCRVIVAVTVGVTVITLLPQAKSMRRGAGSCCFDILVVAATQRFSGDLQGTWHCEVGGWVGIGMTGLKHFKPHAVWPVCISPYVAGPSCPPQAGTNPLRCGGDTRQGFTATVYTQQNNSFAEL
jgi:hypothetical protein